MCESAVGRRAKRGKVASGGEERVCGFSAFCVSAGISKLASRQSPSKSQPRQGRLVAVPSLRLNDFVAGNVNNLRQFRDSLDGRRL